MDCPRCVTRRWVDLEPQFADALLEALRAEGVAAYAAPAPGRRGPYMDVILPDRPPTGSG